MPYVRNCKKCGKPTELLSQYCEDCFLKRWGILKSNYRERPKCREAVQKLLTDNPSLTLFKIAFWTEYDHVPIVPSDGLKTQARKMLREERR
jgi:hypothetical protein